MDILFVGVENGTSRQRALALGRLGHRVFVVNSDHYVPKQRVLAKLQWETGGLLFQRRVERGILQAISGQHFDVTWVENGRYVGPQLVRQLRRNGPVVNYIVDNPFAGRDRYAWLLFRRAVPEYDLMVSKYSVEDGYRAGAKKMLKLFLAADEIAHAPRLLTLEDHARWDSDVLFVGTWFPERGPFMAELLEKGVPLSIYGNRWQKAPEWTILQRAWKGPGTTNDTDYATALQCAKICLGLLSKGNRDLHTHRSIEVPAIGSLLCAERTVEHEQLYRDREEAVFWKDAAECATLCKQLLADDAKRQQIARQGHRRCLENGHFNEPVLAKILEEALCR